MQTSQQFVDQYVETVKTCQLKFVMTETLMDLISAKQIVLDQLLDGSVLEEAQQLLEPVHQYVGTDFDLQSNVMMEM